MSTITNLHNLPLPLVEAIKFSDRDREGCDYTITELLMPPRILALKREHEHEITEDASDRIWALMGQLGHEVLKRFGKATDKHIAEERAIAEVVVDGKTFKIGGQIDLIDGGIWDYKFTSVWAVKDGARGDWIAQLNLYRWLAEQYGVPVVSLGIVAILRDWSVREAARDPEYPQNQVKLFDLPIWSTQECREFIERHIRMHEAAKMALPHCTPEDMWEKPEKWAAKKRGAARATKLFDTQGETAAFAATNGLVIERRPGERPRCESYCVCAPWCSQFQDWKAAQ